MLKFAITSLRVRLMFLIIIALLPALVLIFYTAAEQRQQASAQAQENALRLLRQISGQHGQLIAGTHNFLAILAQLTAVRRVDSAKCSAFFTSLSKQRPLYANLCLINRDGNLLCSSIPASSPINLTDRTYFQRVLKTREFAIGDYQIGRISHKPSLSFGYPVLDELGQVQAVLYAGLDLNWLDSMAAKIKLPPGTALTVIDSSGTILSHYPDSEDWFGKSLTEMPIVQTILKKQGEGTKEIIDLDGIKRLYAFEQLTSPEGVGNVYICLGIPTEIVYAGVNQLFSRNMTGLGLITILVFGLAWVSGNLFFLRRFNALLSATKRLTSGDLSARTGLPYEQGEMGQLARSFDQMAKTLEQRTTQLCQAETKYRSLVEQIPAITFIVTMDKGSKTLYISPQVERTIGFTPAEFLSDNGLWLRQIHPDDCERVQAELSHNLTGGNPFCTEYRIIARDGHTVWVENTAWLVQNENSCEQYLQGVMLDISMRKRAERLASLGTMAAGIAHEINQPLNHIKIIASESLYWQEKDGVTDWSKEAVDLKEILAQVDRIDQIIKRMRAFVRNENSVELVPCNLNKVVEGALKMIGGQLSSHGIEVKKSIVNKLPPILGDYHRLEEVVINLIINAMHALDAFNKKYKEIRVNTLLKENVILQISDNATGVSDKLKERIFEPFFTTKEVGEAMGLGLSIVHSIVTSFGGEIHVITNENGGATFSVEFPVC